MSGSRLLELVAVMDRLRRECPWDRQQTHRSLVRYLLEETHETIEAVESLESTGDPTHLREELGDLLLQVYFHARLAEERETDAFDIEDVAGGIVEKLVRRHPHVFADPADRPDTTDAAAVEASWEQLKAAEKQRSSVLEGIPPTLPALSLAEKVLGRAARVEVDADAVRTAHPPGEGAPADPATALGDELLAAVARARTEGVDPEQALRDAVRRVSAVVREREADAASG